MDTQTGMGEYSGESALQREGEWIPKLGWVNIAENLHFKGKVSGARMTQTSEWWFISITVEAPDEPPEKRPAAVGIDVGLNRLATDAAPARDTKTKHSSERH